MEKIVIFDWGGVVESHENNLQELNESKIRVIKKFNNSLTDEEILKKWPEKNSKGTSIGCINSNEDIDDWFNILKKNMNINTSLAEFKKIYEEAFSNIRYYKDVVKYAHSIKNRCDIAILSNLTPFDKNRINAQYDLSKFNKVYLSFEIGLIKPDKRIYEYVLNDLKIKPENILFIDDDRKNILMAQKYNWNTCQAYGYELDKIKNSVEAFLNNES